MSDIPQRCSIGFGKMNFHDKDLALRLLKEYLRLRNQLSRAQNKVHQTQTKLTTIVHTFNTHYKKKGNKGLQLNKLLKKKFDHQHWHRFMERTGISRAELDEVLGERYELFR